MSLKATFTGDTKPPKASLSAKPKNSLKKAGKMFKKLTTSVVPKSPKLYK